MQDTENLIIQNRHLMDEVKRRIDQLGAINTVAAAVGQSLDLDTTLATALEAVTEIVNAEAAGISLIEDETQTVVLRAQRGWIHDFVVTNPMRIPAGKGLSGQVISNNDLIVYNNLDGTEEFAVPSFKEEHFRSIVMAPMRARGKIIGILSIMSHRPHQFDEEILDVLRAVADTVGVAVENARLYESTVEQEKRLTAILQSTADGIIATDQSGRVQLVNQAAQMILDIAAAKVVGMPLREAPIQPRVRDSLLMALSPDDPDDSKSFTVTLVDGRILAGLVSPVYVENQVDQINQTDGWVIVLKDVTYLREAEVARAQFIQAAAHDMRNPLSITYSSLNMLKYLIEKGQPEEVDEIIRLALNGVDRLQALIDDLLHLEHIESGYGFSLTEIDPIELLQSIGIESKPLLDEKDITLMLEIAPDLPVMSLDRRWFSRAVHNYLGNAAKYTQKGGNVKLRAGVQDNKFHIEVVDNGPGIPIQDQSHLFERFYRVEGNEEIRGTGLGLAIVKSVAEAHGGSVYLHSKIGQGSTFGMALPIQHLS